MYTTQLQINTLLICDDFPSASYGTGQRLLAIKRALDSIGECRILYLNNDETQDELGPQDYVAPRPIAKNTSKFGYIVKKIFFYNYQIDHHYDAKIKAIKKEFNFDVAICSFFRNTPVAPTKLVPCLLDIDAIEELAGTSVLSKLLWPFTKLMMQRRARDFKKVLYIRPSDIYLFKKSQHVDFAYLPGFSATALPGKSVTKNQSIIIVGSMQWLPNRDAIDALIRLHLPNQLVAKGWTLRLIGSGTDRYKNINGVDCAGFVEDINDEYRQAGMAICPIWSGAGANIKLAEAIQMGCAVVATGHSAAGYAGFLVPDRDFLVGATPQDFIKQIMRLVEDDDLRVTLEKNAKKFAAENLTQAKMTHIVTNAVKQAIA